MRLVLPLAAWVVLTLTAAVDDVKDIDECASDPSYAETMKKVKAGQNKGSWKDWMVVPKDKTSGYGICYYNALNNKSFNMLQKHIPLADTLMPMCRNLSPKQNSNQTSYDERINGFECTCPDPPKRQEIKVLGRFGFSCPNPACATCRTELNYECVDSKCRCKRGYSERAINGVSQCIQRECGNGEVFSPQLIANRHQMDVICDSSTFRYVPRTSGFRLIRDDITQVVIDAVDVNECLEQPDICCASGTKCTGPNCLKCMNTKGNYTCGINSIVCDARYVDRNTCKCRELACTKTTSWYMDCYGEPNVKDLGKEKRVCSRIFEAKTNSFKSFENEQALFDYSVKFKCDCCFLAAKPDKFASNPVLNYYGACQPKAEQVVCPNGGRATMTKAGPWCPINSRITDFPLQRAGVEIGTAVLDPKMCLPLPNFCLLVPMNGRIEMMSQ